MENEHKLITGDKLIAGLLELGIVDNRTCKVKITAEIGDAIILEITKFGDDRLLQLVGDGHVMVTHDEAEAICR